MHGAGKLAMQARTMPAAAVQQAMSDHASAMADLAALQARVQKAERALLRVAQVHIQFTQQLEHLPRDHSARKLVSQVLASFEEAMLK